MSWLLHPEPLGPTPFGQGRECRRPASGKFPYQVWWHQFVGGVSCSSIVGLNKPHLLQRWRKKDGAYLPGKPDEDRLRRARLAWVQSLFPGPWQQQVRPAKTGARLDPILGVINVEKACPASMGDDKNTARHRFSWYRVQFLATRPEAFHTLTI